MERERERRTDRQTDRPTDGRTDRQAGRQADRASLFPLRLQVQEQLQNVVEIQGADSAFACIREDGSVVTWGHAAAGGDCSRVRCGVHGMKMWLDSVITKVTKDGWEILEVRFFRGSDLLSTKIEHRNGVAGCILSWVFQLP